MISLSRTSRILKVSVDRGGHLRIDEEVMALKSIRITVFSALVLVTAACGSGEDPTTEAAASEVAESTPTPPPSPTAVEPAPEEAAPTPTPVPEPVREQETFMRSLTEFRLPEVPNSTATLRATNDEAEFVISTNGFEPGHPVSAWIVAIDPAGCAASFPNASVCDPVMVVVAPTVGNIGFLDGGIAADDGTITISGTINSQGLAKQWFDTELISFHDTIFHVLLRVHGPPIDGLVDEQTSTYRAGCTDASVAGPEPADVHDDGTPGPYECANVQGVAFEPEEPIDG